MFQSSPGFEAGRYGLLDPKAMRGHLFQSSPGFEAGRYSLDRPLLRRYARCSNPRPVLRPGATVRPLNGIPNIEVPILARF